MPDIESLSKQSGLSAYNLAQIEAEEALHAQERHRVARLVAASAHDVDDAKLLFEALGLDAAEGLTEGKRASRTAAA